MLHQYAPITTARFPNDHVNGLLETRMDNGRKVITGGQAIRRPQAPTIAEKNWRTKAKTLL